MNNIAKRSINGIFPAMRPIVAGDMVIVYGTLMQGFGNHKRLEMGNPKFTRMVAPNIVVSGEMYDLGAFPGLRPVDPNKSLSHAAGEMYEIRDDSYGRRLDILEGFNLDAPERSLYIRSKYCPNLPVDGQIRDAMRGMRNDNEVWIYYFNDPMLDRRPRS